MFNLGVTTISSDNGVYILETVGPEFRVVYTQAVDNIYGKFNDETSYWNPNNEAIVETFGRSEVFDNVTDSMNYAETLAGEHDWLEDGVCLITDFKSLKFGEM